MNYKVEKALKANKKALIAIGVLWIILTIILVSPIAYSIVKATNNGIFNVTNFFEEVFGAITKFNTFFIIWSGEYIGTFLKTLLYFTMIYLIFCVIGIYRSKPKNEYTDIEHGSSDWSTSGEQYRVLSKNKGILLAQDNYLPINKRGNVNVLVVGRFRFW